MRTGEAICRGYALLGLLAGLAVAGAGLAAWGQASSSRMQRDRESELLFRGAQFVLALEAYAQASPSAERRRPERLEQLLHDRRGPAPRHHLRRLWADPFTGRADWVLLRDAEGGIVGVRSRAKVRAFKRTQVPGNPDALECVCDWTFRVAHQPARRVNARRP